jgi:ribosomal protein L37AE/L43A
MSECRNCGRSYPEARANLGYHMCLPCGDAVARNTVRTTAPLNKSNYVLITNRAELAQLNPKRTGE